MLDFGDGTFEFHELAFTVQPLGETISHSLVVIFKDRVDGEGPRMPSLDPEHVLQWDRFLIGLVHCIRRLLL